MVDVAGGAEPMARVWSDCCGSVVFRICRYSIISVHGLHLKDWRTHSV